MLHCCAIVLPAARGRVLPLRPYQFDLVSRVRAEIAAGRRRVVKVMATGAGKTITAGALIHDAVDRGERVLFLAHRHELIHQAYRKLWDLGITDLGMIKAGFPMRSGAAVQVASVQTLHARAIRSSRMDLPTADLVVIDEAHHCPALTYRKIIESYAGAVIIGLTATPCRTDGRGLGTDFEVIVEGPSVDDLIVAGYLVPTRVYAPSRPDLKGVRVKMGDYVEAQLAARMAPLIGDIVTHWFKHAERRRTVAFCTGVEHSLYIRDEFRRAGAMAEHLDGSTPTAERDQILADLAAGTVEVVTNCMVLTEGWDCPEVACIILARPTKSLGLFRQMAGRGLRPAPGKRDLLLLDHAGTIFEHGFIEESITWTLDEDRRAENRAQTSRAQHRAPELVICPECKAIRREGSPCPSCGWRPQPKPKAVDIAEGELGEVDRQKQVHQRKYSTTDKNNFFRQLLWIARERGYKPGWAAHKFKEKFGTWPPRGSPVPTPPDDATRSWVRSRQIAFAKAKQAEGGSR
jgi:DNA repair protein RadD